MEASGPSVGGRERSPLPLALKLLLLHAALVAVKRAADVALGLMFDPHGPPMCRALAAQDVVISLLHPAVVAAGAVWLLVRPRWGLAALAASWCVDYVGDVWAYLPSTLAKALAAGSSGSRWDSPLTAWVLPVGVVVVGGLLTAVYVAYLLGLRAAWGREASPAAARLPAAAKLFAVFAVANHAPRIVMWVGLLPVYAYTPSMGRWSFLSLLSGIPYSMPIGGIALGAAGVVSGVALLFRWNWGRWVFIGVTCLEALQQAGMWLFWLSALDDYGVLSGSDLFGAAGPSVVRWNAVAGLALTFAWAGFLIAYVADKSVKAAMRALEIEE